MSLLSDRAGCLARLANAGGQVFSSGTISYSIYFLFFSHLFFLFPSEMSVIWVLDFLSQYSSHFLLSYFCPNFSKLLFSSIF